MNNSERGKVNRRETNHRPSQNVNKKENLASIPSRLQEQINATMRYRLTSTRLAKHKGHHQGLARMWNKRTSCGLWAGI